jgi:hypothetical protein
MVFRPNVLESTTQSLKIFLETNQHTIVVTQSVHGQECDSCFHVVHITRQQTNR